MTNVTASPFRRLNLRYIQMTDKEMMALLHQTLAENLLARVKDPEAKSSDLNVARQFLKDNGIDALPVEGSPLSDLVATLPDFSDDTFDVSELRLKLIYDLNDFPKTPNNQKK